MLGWPLPTTLGRNRAAMWILEGPPQAPLAPAPRKSSGDQGQPPRAATGRGRRARRGHTTTGDVVQLRYGAAGARAVALPVRVAHLHAIHCAAGKRAGSRAITGGRAITASTGAAIANLADVDDAPVPGTGTTGVGATRCAACGSVSVATKLYSRVSARLVRISVSSRP